MGRGGRTTLTGGLLLHRRTTTPTPTPTPESDRGLLKATGALDVWSFGATMFELVAGISLVYKNLYDQAIPSGVKILKSWTSLSEDHRSLVFQFLPSNRMNKQVVHNAVDLVTRCLARDPNERPGMRDILAHPFLSVMSTKSSDLSMMSSDWFPSPELTQELKWIERGEYASATLEDSLEFKPASTALLHRIKKKFEMGVREVCHSVSAVCSEWTSSATPN